MLYILLIHGLPQETSARRSSPPTSPTSSISRALRAAASPEPEAPEKTAVPNGVRRRALEDGSMSWDGLTGFHMDLLYSMDFNEFYGLDVD